MSEAGKQGSAAKSIDVDRIRADLALVEQIPLYYIDHEASASDHGEEFTLDQHLAFGRLTDALPVLLDELEDLRDEVADLRRMVMCRGTH